MNSLNDSGMGTGISILSLDNGGPGSYAQLIFVKEYMGSVAADSGVTEEEIYPADYFDLMGGVGFGGLIAIMLGYLRMNVEETTEALITIAEAIFSRDADAQLDLKRNSEALKNAVEDMLHSRGVPLTTKLHDQSRPSTRCKVVLYAATTANMSHSQAFRTYPSRGSSLNPTIVEAICATMSNASLFHPVKIGPRSRQQSFAGAALGASNPTRELLQEACTVFGKDARVAQIVSLGCGLPRVLSLESSDAEKIDILLREMSADCEIVAKELSTRLLNLNAYLRLNVDRGMESVSMTDWGELDAIESHTRAYMETAVVTGVIDASLTRLKERIGSVTLAQISQSSSIKVTAKEAPALSPYHVTRKKESDLMVHHLVTSAYTRQKIFPITGMGGCGKTQLVSHFLQEHSSLYAHCVFVDASSSSSIKSDLQAWAQSLGEGHERDVWEDSLRILRNVPRDQCSALIFDNADDPSLDLLPFIPQSKYLTIIITSRNRNLRNLSTTYHLEMSEMEDDEALMALLQASQRQLPLPPEELTSANTLMRELGNLAVALVQVGTYCHELSSTIRGVFQPYTFTQYLSLFISHRAELLKQAGPSALDNYQRGVYTTFDLSYRAIPHVSKEVFHVLSFFHHTSIPVAALAAAADRNFRDAASYLPRPASHEKVISDLTGVLHVDGKWSELHMQEIIRTLRSFSLLSATSVDDSVFLQLHPLVQAWSRDMDPSSSQHYRAMATQVITTCAVDENKFRLYRYLLPHVIDLASQHKDRKLHVNDVMAAGNILIDRGHSRAATGILEAALEIMTNSSEAEDEVKTTIQVWLATAYWGEGRWSEAEKLELEVLDQRQRIMGKDHLDTIGTAANLAATYREQGRWCEAEKLELEVLEQRQRIMGKGHLDTIAAAANLAATHRRQGRWSEAEKLELEVLEQSRSVLGREHPNTIMAVFSLAATYWNQGRWSEAETLGLEVLEQRRRIIGKDHPEVIIGVANLAATYREQGRWSEAEELELEVLEQRTRILGKHHPDTISAASNLAATYRNRGRLSEAEMLQVEVLEQCRRLLGKDHPNTITGAGNLASTYRQQGRWSEAEKLQLEVLEQGRRILGKDHPDTISAARQLSRTYHCQGRLSEAEELGRGVLQQRGSILGQEHPATILASAGLAAIHVSQNRLEEALLLLAPVVQLSLKVIGKQHPDTQNHVLDLVSLYEKLDKAEEAKKTRELLLS